VPNLLAKVVRVRLGAIAPVGFAGQFRLRLDERLRKRIDLRRKQGKFSS
jgi:hypothetical protein